ncbi:YceI family protein [Paracrocinitomix mangrovi]|uniref:YceI family protein n=1 Tax=Paracrocinitomix mangrovi TaxID=2862509 RepID=UPI001C8D7083|nr:YceI family protein [Paracrocinitomix mangrovi]UKN01751.1 YceI family protein [Paracrocinitomix mangrovi]
MKTIAGLLFITLLSINSFAQLSTDKAFISFYSEMDDITAENSNVKSEFNMSTGEISFTVSIDKFIFKNSTMQKHFNQEGVMNSEKFPKATFTGKIVENSAIDYTANGTHKVKVKGKMTIKGISKEIEVNGELTIDGAKITATSKFSLDRFEYGVDGKKESVSQILAITVKANY